MFNRRSWNSNFYLGCSATAVYVADMRGVVRFAFRWRSAGLLYRAGLKRTSKALLLFCNFFKPLWSPNRQTSWLHVDLLQIFITNVGPFDMEIWQIGCSNPPSKLHSLTQILPQSSSSGGKSRTLLSYDRCFGKFKRVKILKMSRWSYRVQSVVHFDFRSSNGFNGHRNWHGDCFPTRLGARVD